MSVVAQNLLEGLLRFAESIDVKLKLPEAEASSQLQEAFDDAGLSGRLRLASGNDYSLLEPDEQLGPLKMESKYYFTCPNCDSERKFNITHLVEQVFEDSKKQTLPSHTFGPWGCDKCSHQIRGKLSLTPFRMTIDLTSEPSKLPHTAALALLCADTPGEASDFIYLVVPTTVAADPAAAEKESKRLEYLYDEHICPSDVLKRALLVAQGGSDDPHGAFTFIKHVQIRDFLPDFPQDYDFEKMGLSNELNQAIRVMFPHVFKK